MSRVTACARLTSVTVGWGCILRATGVRDELVLLAFIFGCCVFDDTC